MNSIDELQSQAFEEALVKRRLAEELKKGYPWKLYWKTFLINLLKLNAVFTSLTFGIALLGHWFNWWENTPLLQVLKFAFVFLITLIQIILLLGNLKNDLGRCSRNYWGKN